MANSASPQQRETRPVGRPRTIEVSQASLSQLLNLVRTGRATTRQELERQSELGRAAVADRLATLSELGLIEDGELGTAVGGRAPRHVRFREGAGTILLAMLDRTSLGVGLSDLAGTPLVEHHEAIDLASGPSEIVERLSTLFHWLLEDRADREVWGIGLAVPGPVEPLGDAGFTAPAVRALQTWQDFPFVEELATRFGAPVWVRSDVQMMTMGELRSGAGAGLADMLFVKLGRAISAGLVCNGRLQDGAQGAAGMIGYSTVGTDYLEAVASVDAVARDAVVLARDGQSPYLAALLEREGEIGAIDVGHGAQFGDAACTELLARAGRLIGEALAPLANLVNPAAIVLGGTLAQTGDSLLAAVREAVYRQSHPLVTRDLRIVRSQMGSSAGLVGAAQVVTEALFASDFLSGWIAQASPRRHPGLEVFIEQAQRTLRRAPPPLPPGSG